MHFSIFILKKIFPFTVLLFPRYQLFSFQALVVFFGPPAAVALLVPPRSLFRPSSSCWFPNLSDPFHCLSFRVHRQWPPICDDCPRKREEEKGKKRLDGQITVSGTLLTLGCPVSLRQVYFGFLPSMVPVREIKYWVGG